MTDDKLPVEPVEPPPSPAEQAEAARTRRRWLTLAELLGVAAVLISGLTLWNNYLQRTGEQEEKAAARREASASQAAAHALLLRGTPDREGRQLALAPGDPAQTIQDQRIMFASELGIDPIETVSDPRIEADWFSAPLLRRTADDARSRGDLRLPVAVTTRFIQGGESHSDTAIYDLGYRIEGGGLLSNREVRLRGLSRVAEVAPDEAQARLDALSRRRTGN